MSKEARHYNLEASPESAEHEKEMIMGKKKVTAKKMNLSAGGKDAKPVKKDPKGGKFTKKGK